MLWWYQQIILIWTYYFHFVGSSCLGSSAANSILKLSCYQSIKVVEENPFLECFLSSQETSMQYDKNGQKKQAPDQSITWSVGIAHIVLTHFLLCLMNPLSAIYVNQEFYIWKARILKPKALNNTSWNNHLDILLAAIPSYRRQKIVMTMSHSHINSFQQLCHL